MYPTLSDLLHDLFGWSIRLPVQTFGLILAISFFLAAWTLSIELKRKQALGLVNEVKRKVLKGEPASATELITSALFGFVIGFKLLYVIYNYSEFVDDTQGTLLSAKGNWIGGFALAAIFAYLKYSEKKKAQLENPETVEETLSPFELTGNFTMVAAVTGLLGAKIFHNLENLDEFARDPWGSIFSFSGLTFYGGLIFGTAGVIWYGRKNNIKAIHLCDANAPGLMVAYAMGRLGCQLAGDGDWGITNTAPKPAWMNFLPDWVWSYNYPHNVISEGAPIPGCEGRHCMMLVDPVFPTPLYESTVCFILFFILWRLRKKISVPGILFCIYLIVNGIERFLVEQIRVNTKYHLFGHAITQAEIISFLLIVVGIAGIFYLRKRNKISHG